MSRLLTGFIVFIAGAVLAITPPTPDEIASYKKDGSYAQRLEFALKLGNYQTRPDVARHALARLNNLATLSAAPLPAWQGMPTKGTNNILVFLVDFPDYPHANDASVISNKLFGDGISSEFPRESLRNFYRRSSFNQLELRGNALGWYRMQHNRSWYTSTYADQNEANRAIIQEVVSNYDSTHNFAQYDNNHDGFIDYFAVIWSGPDNGWANFWWGYQWELNTPIAADGVQFKSFSWQWEARPVGSGYEATTIIHETGHALGLPDYYDYDGSIGPDGGVGGLDMMDGAYSDHNSFSKFMLDWISPMVVPLGTSNVTLIAQSQSSNMVAVMPGYSGATPYTEFFFAENRYRTNNDMGNPGDGILIWHVDATPVSSGDDFLYNNSYTSHKLLRLMEADGLEQIEAGGDADAGDYHTQGDAFSDVSVPNSWAYAGTNTYVTLDSFSTNGPRMTLTASIQAAAPGPRIVRSPSILTASAYAGENPTTASFYVSATGGTVGYAISKNTEWLAISPASASSSGTTNLHTVTYATATLDPGLYSATITITSPDAVNSPQTITVNLAVMGNNIGRAVNATNLVWSGGGASLWFEQNTVSEDGVAAAQSGALANLQTNWIQTSVTGPGLLSFWWKVSSEVNYDYLRFYIDGVERAGSISGTVDWQNKSYSIGNGAHTVRWAYTKDISISSGADAGWVDEVNFTSTNVPTAMACSPRAISAVVNTGQDAASQIMEVWNDGGGSMSYSISVNAAWLSVTPPSEISSGPYNQHAVLFNTSTLGAGAYTAAITITAAGAIGSPTNIPVTIRVSSGAELMDAIDCTNGVWSTYGNNLWSLVTSPSHDGIDAAQSGPISNSQESSLELSILGPGILTFWTKVSSEPSFDYLFVLVDGEYRGISYSGETDWLQDWIEIASGSHTVRWLYSKDSSDSAGQDAAWLDQVSFSPGAPGIETLLLETFDTTSLPGGWSVRDNSLWGETWTFSNPARRANDTGGTGGFAVADSDWAGFVQMDTDLQMPAMNFADYTNVTLQFNTAFYVYEEDYSFAYVNISTNGGNNWDTVWYQTLDYYGPVRLNLPQAAGRTNVLIRFNYTAYYEYWWEIDDVKITAQNVSGAGGMASAWRQAWEDFDQNYANFTLKGVNWAPVFAAYSNTFAQIHDTAAFAVQLNTVLQQLHDWQVAVREPGNVWLGYNGTAATNCSAQIYTNYVSGNYTDVRDAHALYHSWIGGTNFACIIVSNLNSAVFTNITDADLNSIFQRYSGTKGIILDLRRVTGGDMAQAERLASHFTDLPRTYGYSRARVTGADHDAFGAYSPRILNPSASARFTNVTACLIGQNTMGAAEWLALMMTSRPQTLTIGDHTRGALASAAEFALANFDTSYFIPRTIAYSPEMVPIGETGIAPQIAIAPGASSFNDSLRKDYVLDRALLLLSRPELGISPIPSHLIISWPAVAGYQYTLLRSTNLVNGPWTLAPGWTSNRSSGPMIYIGSEPYGSEFYRIEISPAP
jgi:M6 family metalloprotease-like protein